MGRLRQKHWVPSRDGRHGIPVRDPDNANALYHGEVRKN